MTYNSQFLAITFFCLLLAACSGIPVSQDFETKTDFSVLKYYRWSQSLLADEHKVEGNDPLLNQRIHKAIDQKLASMGYLLNQKDESNLVDFIVSYQTKNQSKLSSAGTSTSFSFGFGSFNSFSAFGISSGDRVHEQDEQNLSIDVVNSHTNRLLWRGESTRTVYKEVSPEELTETIDSHVDAILEQFPPGKKKTQVE